MHNIHEEQRLQIEQSLESLTLQTIISAAISISNQHLNNEVKANLGEAYCCRLFSKTLTAQIKAIFADETSLVGTEAAKV